MGEHSILPEVMIIGAGRSGTTSLFQYLKPHPQICFSSQKEVLYFSNSDLFNRGPSYLESFFKNCTEHQISVSSDTYLLVSKDAPLRMREYNPNMKIIALIRNPIQRAVSSYIYAINNGYQKANISLLEHFHSEQELIKNRDIITINNLGHFNTGLYHQHLSRWRNFFPSNQILAVNSELFFSDPQNILQRIYAFIGVDEIELPTDYEVHNKATTPKSKSLQQVLANRNHPLRQWLRKNLPQKLKDVIFTSKVIEKLKSANLSKTKQFSTTLGHEEKQNYISFFKEDQERLMCDFGIQHL